MPKVMKTCRVCGRPYEACRTVNDALGVFRWQEVACSPECGAIYLRKLNESRGIHAEKPTAEPVGKSVVKSDTEQTKHPERKKKAKNTGVTHLRLEADSEGENTGNK